MKIGDEKFFPDGTTLVTPKNYLKIEEIFAFISTDENGEGVIADTMIMHGELMQMPFVCADKARVDSLRKRAKEIAKMSGKKIKLIRLSLREDIEEIG